MISGRTVVTAEALAALVALALAGWCASSATVTTRFEPVVADAPAFDSSHYSGAWIAGATALATIAGLLVVDAVRRIRAHTAPGA